MKRIAAVVSLLSGLSAPASAQLTVTGVGGGFGVTAGGPYSGPGDVVSGAKAWWGLRGYSLAYATGLGNAAIICLPADTVCDTATIASNGSLVVPGTLSTCNNSTVLCTIKELYDQSGANNCSGATPCHMINATIAQRPLYVVPGGGSGCSTASLPCINWNLAGQHGLSVGATFGGVTPQPFSFSVVASLTSSAVAGGIFTCVSGSIFLSTDTTPNFNIYAGTTQGVSMPVSTWFTFQNIFQTTSSLIYKNGAVSGALNPGPNVCGSPDTATMGWDTFNHFYPGFTVELGYWAGALNATQAGNLNTNQRAYWGF